MTETSVLTGIPFPRNVSAETSTINVKMLRNEMRRIIDRVRKGEDFTVLYRSRPAFRIVPLSGAFTHGVAEEDSLYRAEAVGRSDDGLAAEHHDRSLYGQPHA